MTAHADAVAPSEELLAAAKALLDQEVRALTGLQDQLAGLPLARAVEAILACQGMVMITGAGTSSSIARRMAHVLTCSGVPAIFLDAGQAQHGYGAVVTARDLVIAFSRGGETDEVNALLRVARSVGARLLSISENPDSTMASLSDLTLTVRIAAQDDALGPIPLASTLVHAALADVLCAAVLKHKGFDPARFAEVHPGGAVGKRLRQVPASSGARTGKRA